MCSVRFPIRSIIWIDVALLWVTLITVKLKRKDAAERFTRFGENISWEEVSVHWLDTPNNSPNVSKSTRECVKICMRKWHPQLHCCHRRTCYSHPCGAKCDQSIQIPPEKQHGKWGKSASVVSHPLLYLQTIQRDMISHNAQFSKEVNKGGMGRKGRKLGEREGEGGFCFHISHGRYRKQPDAVHQRQRPENRLPYLSNEEVKGECGGGGGRGRGFE